MESLSKLLKEETKLLHAETERQLGAKAIFSDQYSLNEYFEHLQHLYKAHLITEYILNDNQVKEYLFIKPIRSKDILLDLIQIQPDFQQIIVNSLSKSSSFNSFESKIGLIYVVSGSQLGGAFIASKINEHLPTFGLNPQHFYATNSENLMVKWKQWCNNIDQLPLSESQISEVIQGAKDGFNLFATPTQFASLATKPVL
jgi:heme oxygenase